MNGLNFMQGWVGLAGWVATIALVLTAFGLMLGMVKPVDAPKQIGTILAVAIFFMCTPAILAKLWSAIPLWQRIGLIAIVFCIWQWQRLCNRSRKNGD